MITAVPRRKGTLSGERDAHPTHQFGSGYQQIWGLCGQIWIFCKFFSFIWYTTNTLIDAKYLYGKNMLGMGVGWYGLIGPWSECGGKIAFFKKQTSKSLEKNKALSSASWCVFFSFPLLFAAPGRGGSGRSPPSVGAYHTVLLQFYISIKAM